MPGLTRREVVFAAVVASITGCARGSDEVRWAAGRVRGLSARAWVERDIELDAGDGRVVRAPVFLRLGDKRGVRALWPGCTCRLQEGRCEVRWVEETRHFICPCHGGIYDERGQVVGGPPKRPLEPRRARVEDGTVYIIG